ncbi:MAG TPA: hypothetical protein VFE04_10255 [Puia sp.]|nr:hypothetical protein [Puia sp.]
MILDLIFTMVGVYLICGLLFALIFVFRGAEIIDEAAKGSTIGFKIIIIPATTVFWPLLLIKWIKASKTRSND